MELRKGDDESSFVFNRAMLHMQQHPTVTTEEAALLLSVEESKND